MPIDLKQNTFKYKDPTTGEYKSVDTLGEMMTFDAEAYAKGTKQGVPVSSGEHGYQDNAKYYKELTQVMYESIPQDYTELTREVADLNDNVNRLNDGGLILKDDVIAENVTDWLDNHPEATTTVQDGSLTLVKFASGEIPFGTPEMYGAKGDGNHDDTNAINQALENHSCVVLGSKTYKTTAPVYVPSNTTLIGVDKNKSKIYNVGTGFNKNAVIAGIVNGDSASDQSGAILFTDSVQYTKNSDYTFTTDVNIQTYDLVHFKVLNNDNGLSQMYSTSTYIIGKNGNIYTTRDPIPDNAELHLYADVIGSTDGGLRNYVTYGSTIQNLTIEHLPTGSGMYCLFICGAEFIAKDLNVIGNTGMASNLSVHGLWENINVISYGDNLDCAEYIYYTKYKNISITKAAQTAQTLHEQLAFGRGHDNVIVNFNSNIENALAFVNSNKILVSDSDFIINAISATNLLNDITFKNCKIRSSSGINLLNLKYVGCYIEKPILAASNNALLIDCETDFDGILDAAKEKIHKIGYKNYLNTKVGSLASYDVPDFDYAYMVTVTGNNISVTNGSATVTATSELSVIRTNSGLIRLQKDYGGYYGPGWSYNGTLTFSGGITTVEKKPLAI